MSNSLRPHGLQRARLPCASLSPRVCLNSCPLIWLWHPTISSSVALFSFCLQSFPELGSFPVSQLFASGSQSNGASASALILSMNIQGWFPLGLIDVNSLLSKGLSRVFSSTTVQRHQFFNTQPFFNCPASHAYMTTVKTIALTIWTFLGKVMSLLFNTLSMCVITFLPRSKHLLISWLQSPTKWFWSPGK